MSSAVSVPELIDAAVAHVTAGVPREEAAEKLVALAGGDRSALELAHILWARRMHQLPSDDFAATAVLRTLLAALDRVPRPVAA